MIYTAKNPEFPLKQFKYLGFLLCPISIYLIIDDSVLYILLLLMGIALSSLSDGVQLNTDQKKYRDYLSVFWMKIGKWNMLGKVLKIRVFPQQISQNVGVSSVSGVLTDSCYRITLESENSIIDAGTFKNKEEALKYSKLLENEFNVMVEVE